MDILRASVAVCLLVAMFVGGCSDGPSSIDGGTADGDTDTDADTDSDTDTDTGPDIYGDPCAGEVEVDGVFWCRCDVGQSWNGEICEGDSKGFDWESASESCPVGYVVAHHFDYAELLGNCNGNFDDNNLIFCDSCSQSDSCISIFGDTIHTLWTANSYDAESDLAWVVILYPGELTTIDMYDTARVRCLRY